MTVNRSRGSRPYNFESVPEADSVVLSNNRMFFKSHGASRPIACDTRRRRAIYQVWSDRFGRQELGNIVRDQINL
jgi:hypothetical protein